jgi:AraC-like DNA-binding protein
LDKRDRERRFLAGAMLDPKAAADAIRLNRHRPAAPLQAFVRHYWFVRWDLGGRPPHSQATLPLPAVNAVIEADGSRVFGIASRRFDKVLQGHGAAFGILFRSAGFAPFFDGSLHQLVDRSLGFSEVFGCDADEFRRVCAETDDDARLVAELDRFLLNAPRNPSDEAQRVQAWVDLVESDPEITRTEQLADRVGVALRTLQRLMRQYVGIAPKALIRRYRLLEAAGQIVRQEYVNFAHLSAALGYNDQSHFIRDFTSVIGTSPARYAAAQRRSACLA